MTQIFLLHIASCLFATGLIWTIQLVHYPTFMWIDKTKFTDFAVFHANRISIIVVPVMLVELFTGIALVYEEVSTLSIANLSGIICIWLVTFLISVPCHDKLVKVRDEITISRLINTNWLRTVLWTIRSVGLTYVASM